MTLKMASSSGEQLPGQVVLVLQGGGALGAYQLGVYSSSWYRTEPLHATLAPLIDFELLKAKHTRLTVGAVNVKSGELRYFDNTRAPEPLALEHVMASGALPPAFPAIAVDGEPYWDGGIYSNTPIEAVLDDHPRRDSVIFSVNVWQPAGPEPQSIWDVLGRQKNIQYASRADSHIARHKQIHRLRHIIRKLSHHLPEEKRGHPDVKGHAGHGCGTTMHIVRFLLSLAPALVAPGWAARAWAATLPRASAVPGGVARVGLGASEQPPRVHLGGDRVLVMRDGDEWVAFVGIALSAKPGSKLRVEAEQAGDRVERFEIAVAPKEYASQHLKVPPGQVDLSKEHLTRYERERMHLSEVLRTFTDSAPATLAMLQPAPGERSSSFGLRRYFNGRARSPHNGMDFAAPAGTPVIAANAGRVIDTGD